MTIGMGIGLAAAKVTSALKVSLPLVSDLVGRFQGALSFSRASKQWVQDYEGIYRQVWDGCAAFPGTRIVTNLLTYSQDMTPAEWGLLGTGTTKSGNVVTFGSGIDNQLYNSMGSSIQYLVPGSEYRFSVKIAAVSGSFPVQLLIRDATSYTSFAIQTVTLTTTPQLFSIKGTATSAGRLGVVIRTTSPDLGSAQVFFAQLEIVTGASNQNPGEYVPTTNTPATKSFDYLNPYTVAGNGVVSDSGVRTRISGVRGTEKLANTTLTNTGNWTTSPEITIGGGELRINAAPNVSFAYTYGNLLPGAAGATVEVKFTIKSISEGGVHMICGNTSSPLTRTTPGDYTEILVTTTSSTQFYLQTQGASTTAVITKVSVKDVTYPTSVSQGVLIEASRTNRVTCYSAIPADTYSAEMLSDTTFDNGAYWNLGTNWSIVGGQLQANNVPMNSATFATGNVGSKTNGHVYEITYTITSFTSGSVRLVSLAGQGQIRTAPGTYTERIVAVDATNAIVYFQAYTAGSTFVIDNVSAKEVTLAVGTKANATNASAVDRMSFSGFNQTTGNLVVGAQYKIVTRTTLDFMTCGAATNNVGQVFTATSAGTLGAGDSVDNLSVSLSIVDDTTELINAGLIGINPSGKVYKVDNTLGAGALFPTPSGGTANTNNHSLFCYVRGTGSSGLSAVRFASSGIGTTFVPTATYTKVVAENKTLSVLENMQIRVHQGEVVYFILPQMEEGGVVTSPIVTAGGTATRAATMLTLPTANNMKSSDFTVYVEAIPVSATITGGYPNFVFTGADGNNYWSMYCSQGTAFSSQNKIGGVTTGRFATRNISPVIGSLYKLAAIHRSSGETAAIFVNGVKGIGTGTDGSSIPIGGNIPIGNTSTTGGYFIIRNLRIYTKPLTDQQLLNMTAV